MILPGCVCPPTRKMFIGPFLTARCLRMNHGRQIVFRFSNSGWTRGVLHKQVVRAGIFVREVSRPHRRLLVGDHFAKVGDVLFDAGDRFRPGGQALVRYSGSVLSFGFGEGFEGVLQLLLKRGAGHKGKGITRASSRLRECAFMVPSLDRCATRFTRRSIECALSAKGRAGLPHQGRIV